MESITSYGVSKLIKFEKGFTAGHPAYCPGKGPVVIHPDSRTLLSVHLAKRFTGAPHRVRLSRTRLFPLQRRQFDAGGALQVRLGVSRGQVLSVFDIIHGF